MPIGRSRFLVPLIYLVAGIGWVVGSDYALGSHARISSAALVAGSLKGIAFVVVSALLLLAVQRAPAAYLEPKRMPLPGNTLRPLLIFLITVAGLGLAGVVVYRQQTAELYGRTATELTNAAEQAGSDIEAWLRARRANMAEAARNPLLVEAIAGFVATRDPAREQTLETALDVLARSEGLARVTVFLPDGRVVAAAGDAITFSPELARWSKGAIVTGRVVTSDLYVPPGSTPGEAAVDFIASVAAETPGSKPIAILVGRADPRDFLIPLLSSWPHTQEAGAFALARREGDHALLLAPELTNGHRSNNLTRVEFGADGPPSIQILGGRRGVFESSEYQSGIPVLAIGRAIATTPWHLVAKVNRDDVYAPLRRLGRLALMLALAGFLTSGAMIALWWRGERLRMAVQLAEVERHANVLSEHFTLAGRFVHDIVLLLEAGSTRIVEANDRALLAYGRKREELLGQAFSSLWPAGSPGSERDLERFQQACAADGGRFATRHVRKDGSSFPVEISARPFVIDGEKFVQAIAYDITDRVEQEQRLAAVAAERDRLLDRLRLQFERMPAACVVVAPDGCMMQVNPAFKSIFGYQLEDVIGRNVREVVRDPVFREQVLFLLDGLREDPDAAYQGVHENLTAQGSAIVCRWTASALRTDDEGVIGMIAMAENITEQIMAERKLKEAHDHLEDRVRERTSELELARQAAEHSDRVKTAFLTTISHELRTPLNSILGFTDVVLQGYSGPLTEAQARQLGIVRDSASHLRALIDDVLDITRIEAGQVSLEFADVDMRELVTRRLAAFEMEAARKGIALHLHCDHHVPVICSDGKRAGQIITNLLANAIKFTDAGSVTVELRTRHDVLEVVVADTGIGIATDAIPGLFKPFSQVPHPEGRLYEGTGLGLAISRNLARALGGDVLVASRQGHGSRFKLRLPLLQHATGIVPGMEHRPDKLLRKA